MAQIIRLAFSNITVKEGLPITVESHDIFCSPLPLCACICVGASTCSGGLFALRTFVVCCLGVRNTCFTCVFSSKGAIVRMCTCE